MNTFNRWFLSVLCLIFTTMVGYFIALRGTSWYNFDYPFPIYRGEYKKIYLADFAYLCFLLVTAYWILMDKFGSHPPKRWNISGILLAISIGLFVAVSVDFVFNYLPKTPRCTSNSLANAKDVTFQICVYDHLLRTWVAATAGVFLSASLVAAIVSFGRTDPEPAQGFQ